MTILILTDGEFYNGGYATIALKIYNNIKNIYNADLFTLVFSKKQKFNVNEIFMHTINLNNEDITNKIMANFFNTNDRYNIIITTSPWSYYVASIYFNKSKIIYFKGGGLKGDIFIENLKNKYILDVNIDLYLDHLTQRLENNGTLCNNNYTIIPTTKIMEIILLQSKILNFNKKNIISPYNFYFFEQYKLDKNIIKIYDLIFVISDHNRIVKNSKFVFEIFNKFPNLNKIVIGKNCDFYSDIKNTTIINRNISLEETLNYFLSSKILLVPSYFDTGPSTIIESIMYGCIPICYYNCGFSMFDIGCISLNNLILEEWCKFIDTNIKNINIEDLIKKSNNLNLLIEQDNIMFNQFIAQELFIK
jgi:hypothetical protein